jgi:transposase
MARRHELSDEQWEIVEPLLPVQRGRGQRFRDHRTLLNGMFWKLCSGAAWRDLPERYGPWETVYSRFRRWTKAGLFGEILKALRLRLAEDGNLDYSTWLVDSTSVRATKAAAGAKKGAASGRSATPEAASARSSTSAATRGASRSRLS